MKERNIIKREVKTKEEERLLIAGVTGVVTGVASFISAYLLIKLREEIEK